MHIGTHKTGTSSVQSYIRKHAEKLKECGVFVPTSGTLGPDSGHHNIAWQIRNDLRFSAEAGGVQELIREMASSSEKITVISSEDFEYLSQYPHELKNFDETINAAGYATSYIVYFRNINDYSSSLYAELITSGFTEDYLAIERAIRKDGYVRFNGDWYYEFRYDRFVESWERIVGSKIRGFSYDDAVAGIGLLPSFLKLIGASNSLIDESRNAPLLNTRIEKLEYERSARMKLGKELEKALQQIADLTARTISQEAEVESERAQRISLDIAFRMSTSWRLTAPLRKTIEVARAIKSTVLG